MDLEHFLNKIFIYISGFNRDWSTRTEAKNPYDSSQFITKCSKRFQETVMNDVTEYRHRTLRD